MARGVLRCFALYAFIGACALWTINHFRRLHDLGYPLPLTPHGLQWSTLPVRYPVRSMMSPPSGKPLDLPRIQYSFPLETASEKETRLKRQTQVKDAFQRCWKSYWKLARGRDELAPISGGYKDHFGGWAATLVDSLDTLYIMGLKSEFQEAVAAVKHVDFGGTRLEEINVFETTIRYLGGLLGAYDLSGEQVLLDKAIEVGDMVYCAFDTPNRMPITRWRLHDAAALHPQVAHRQVLIAEIGSLVLELTRLSQLTGNPKFYDAAARVTDVLESSQNNTHLPGLWPVIVSAENADFTTGDSFTLGGMADSTYEYLPKVYALLGGLVPVYKKLYETAMQRAIEDLLFRPLVPDNADILISGNAKVRNKVYHEPQGQHLGCFVGGMFALGSKLFSLPEHLSVASKLVDGCIWTYKALPSGIMPETFHMAPCERADDCHWDEVMWRKQLTQWASVPETDADEVIQRHNLPKGFTAIGDKRYALRPEAIESIFVLYRITGRKDLLDSAWDMFEAIQKHTKTQLANAALADVTIVPPTKMDSMESFWFAETLKYFYLLYSEPDVVSLDEWVLNTEAHPFKRPR